MKEFYLLQLSMFIPYLINVVILLRKIIRQISYQCLKFISIIMNYENLFF